jgi:hypothetical protein
MEAGEWKDNAYGEIEGREDDTWLERERCMAESERETNVLYPVVG